MPMCFNGRVTLELRIKCLFNVWKQFSRVFQGQLKIEKMHSGVSGISVDSRAQLSLHQNRSIACYIPSRASIFGKFFANWKKSYVNFHIFSWNNL